MDFARVWSSFKTRSGSADDNRMLRLVVCIFLVLIPWDSRWFSQNLQSRTFNGIVVAGEPELNPTSQPSGQPSSQPSVSPTSQPTKRPTGQPTSSPTGQPSKRPSSQPSAQPTSKPTERPSRQPTKEPTSQPTNRPTTQPSRQPSSHPSARPTGQPTRQPTSSPTGQPSHRPSGQPTAQPSAQPQIRPTSCPTDQPTRHPTGQPTGRPTSQPTRQPTRQPTSWPTNQPTASPTGQPTKRPSSLPSGQPMASPTGQPTRQPTSVPTRQPTGQPTRQPTGRPTGQPTAQPQCLPTSRPSSQPTTQPSSTPTRQPTSRPTAQPSRQPTSQPTLRPTSRPSSQPTRQPTSHPTGQPTAQPSAQPQVLPTSTPTGSPTSQPTSSPTRQPTAQPTRQPSAQPSRQPTGAPTRQPSAQPSRQPSARPTGQPTGHPTGQPTRQPSARPSSQPTSSPTGQPTRQPSGQPTAQPQVLPTSVPTRQPSAQPSRQPSGQPTSSPTSQPTTAPSRQPTADPTAQPTQQPQGRPTSQPTRQPSAHPSGQPTASPTRQPTDQPTSSPTGQPTSRPTGQPSRQPSGRPSSQPVAAPSAKPTGQPSSQPSVSPTTQPTSRPTGQPTRQPTRQPSTQPTAHPTRQPTGQPTAQPSAQPVAWPTSQPSRQPSAHPTGQPTSTPTSQPSRQPSSRPTALPTAAPSTLSTSQPSSSPTSQPSGQPSLRPTCRPTAQPTRQPTARPSGQPTASPTAQPSRRPTAQPSGQPSGSPTRQPTSRPTGQPTGAPTRQPTAQPSSIPTCQPSRLPSGHPTSQPSRQPTTTPTSQPSGRPTGQPTASPTGQPTEQPTVRPSRQPTGQPSGAPTSQPSRHPTGQPSASPSSRPTGQPTSAPTRQPSSQPSSQPSRQPSGQPSASPTRQPSSQPSARPSGQPTARPSTHPSKQPTGQPTAQPSVHPSGQPTVEPSRQPTADPTRQPTSQPSRQPTSTPTRQPSAQPTGQPTRQPSGQPTANPSGQPSAQPTLRPSSRPSGQPTSAPTAVPTSQPTKRPSSQPSGQPSVSPTSQPTAAPSRQPTTQPSAHPTRQPTAQPSGRPTRQPSGQPSRQPSALPTDQPSSQPSVAPTGQPTVQPSLSPSAQPSGQPSLRPTAQPTSDPSGQPTRQPTAQPSTLPTAQPTRQPTTAPTAQPTMQPSSSPSGQPTSQPTIKSTSQPTCQPTSTPSGQPSAQPSSSPSSQPSVRPSAQPSGQPSLRPSAQPTGSPSAQPTMRPTTQPTVSPTAQPSGRPTGQPSVSPTAQPSIQPTGQPSSQPTAAPSRQPSADPTAQPSHRPTAQPSLTPTSQPSGHPTGQPSSQPSLRPSAQPSCRPSAQPSAQPTLQPSSQPSTQPTTHPTAQPTSSPSAQPSLQPSVQPTRQPTAQPTMQPSMQPSAQPTTRPSMQPSGRPSAQPTMQPSAQPSTQPSVQPTRQPTMQPTAQPSSRPTTQPSRQPTSSPTTGPTSQPTRQPSPQPTSQPSRQPTTAPSAQPTSQPSTQPTSWPTGQPTGQPSAQPSSQPTSRPTGQPSSQPSSLPSAQPSRVPSSQPSRQPSSQPTRQPSMQPTVQPTQMPSAQPSTQPTTQPSSQPSGQPTGHPTAQPSRQPTSQPSAFPTGQPTLRPSALPTSAPTRQPSAQPSRQPTLQPSSVPSAQPSAQPSQQPSSQPSVQPSAQPSSEPSVQPTAQPSGLPSVQPTAAPTGQPTSRPSMQPTAQPSVQPTSQPSAVPTSQPTSAPSGQPSVQPSTQPSQQPTVQPTSRPTTQPSGVPTAQPSSQPTVQPSSKPSAQPSAAPSGQPTTQPSSQPSVSPSTQPTVQPSAQPSAQPTGLPSGQPTSQPSSIPSMQPTSSPTSQPSSQPTSTPTSQPTSQPTLQPSAQPTSQPTVQPSSQPTLQPSAQPSGQPSTQPTSQPSMQPSAQPTSAPSTQPSSQPTAQPSAQPTMQPTLMPTSQPSMQPSAQPTSQPSLQPSAQPTADPSAQPSSQPSTQPSAQPTMQPSSVPSSQPSIQPTAQPTGRPSSQPSVQPTSVPSTQPTAQPAMQPSAQPVASPTTQPTSQPTDQPSAQPSSMPSAQPTGQPSGEPTAQPSSQPSALPSSQPTMQPTTEPSAQPSSLPSSQPSAQPSVVPTLQPSSRPTSVPSSQPSSQPTVQPTSQPTRQPSAQPTSEPSGQPTSQPSGQPSNQPTGQPTLQPSLQPSSAPSSQPSSQPTQQPLTQPSSTPSGQPSAQPSSEPSGQPTSEPSAQPSAQPSTQPTSQPTNPTAIPTTQPSGQPTGQPSRQPTTQPSRQPTRQPTGQPSRQPTGQPSTKPTAVPTTSVPTTSAPLIRGVKRTHRPTKFPTSQPTSRPSAQPTSTPTLTTESQWSLLLSDLYRRLDTGAKGLVLSTFGELLLQNRVTFGGVADFHRMAYDELKPVLEFNALSSVQLFTTKSLYTAPVFENVTCHDPTTAATIVRRLADSAKYDYVWMSTNISCDGHVWKIHNCPTYAAMKLCVDCFDPCVLEDINARAALPYRCETVGGCLQALVVTSTEPFPPARIVNAVFSDRQTRSVRLTITASDFSFIYCAAMPMDQVPTSVNVVILQNNVRATFPEDADFLFQGLTPATNYTAYCVAKSLSGSTTSYGDMIASALPFSTACCKVISINMVETTFAAGYRSSQAVAVSTTDAPRISAYLSLTHSPAASVNASLLAYRCTFSPVVQLRNNSLVGSGGKAHLSLSCGARIPTGTYTVSSTLKGPSRGEFSVQYPNGNTFTIIDATTVITTAPALQSAVFSDDGAVVTVTFTTPTNKGLLADSFRCSSLFSYPGVAVSNCLWIDARSVRITLYGSTKLAAGSVIALAASPSSAANLKVACPSNIECGPSQSINPASTVGVQKPSKPVVPLVLISAAAAIGECQPLTLDFSSCTGSGGRDWDSVSVRLVSSRGDNVTAVQGFIQATIKTAPKVVVRGGSFRGGTVYTLYVTLCNFLGACGSGRHAVRVTNTSVPLVTVYGPPVRSLKAAEAVSLWGSASYTSCSGAVAGGLVSSALDLRWSVHQQGVEITRLQSVSKDPLKFLLNPYTLTVGQEYQIRLVATDRHSLASTRFSVIVIVARSELYVAIAGGSTRSIVPSLPFELDASKSYDADLSPTARYNDIMLRYRWSCQIQDSANASSLCPFRFDRSERYSGKLTVTPNGVLSADQSYIMTVSVTKDMRQGRAAVVLVPQAQTTCVTRLLSPYFAPTNVNEKVRLSSITDVQVPSLLEWSLLGNSGISLTSAALTPVQYHATPGRSGTGIAFDLAIKANTFAASSTYTFQLSCKQLSGGQYQTVSTATVDVWTNAPPASGSLEVHPTSGVAIRTPFALTARNWVDTELPITYQFSFKSTNGKVIVLRSRTEVQYAQTVLPRGDASLSYNLSVVVSVFDALNANASASESVRVLEAGADGSVPMAVGSALRSARNSTEESRQIIGVYTIQLNQVNCTLAPDCGALNRDSCVTVPHTCGACQEDYTGDSGESNAPCFASERRLLQASLQACDPRMPDACAAFETCVGGFCRAQNKTCPNSCSGHGKCEWSDKHTGLSLTHCAVTDFSCEAACVCHAYYYGVACELSPSQQDILTQGREQLLRAMAELIETDNADRDSVAAWIDMLGSILQVPSELSITAVNQALSLLQLVLESAIEVQLPSSAAQGLTSSINNLDLSLTTLLPPPLAGSTEYDALHAVLKLYGALVAQDLSVSERVESVEARFRAVTTSFYLRDRLNFSAPVLPLEQSLQLWTPQSVYYDPEVAENGADAVALSMFVLRARNFKSGAFNTNPVKLFFHSATARSLDPSTSSKVEVVLQNLNEVDVLKRGTRNITTTCYNRRPVSHSYPCPGGFPDHVVTCTGQAGVVYSRCPFYFHETICTNTSNANVESTQCGRVSYDAHQTVCGCSWPASYTKDTRRYLSAAADDTEVSLASSTQYRVYTFEDVFVPAVAPVKPERTFIAPTAMSVVGGSALVLLLLVLLTDNFKWDVATWSVLQPKKIVAAEEHDDLESSHYPARNRFQRNADSGYKSAKGFGHNTVSSRNWSVDGDLGASGSLPALRFMLLHALPRVFQLQNFFVSLGRELLLHHRWVSVLFHYSAHYPRWMRFLCIATHINLALLCNYMVITLSFSNGKHCHAHLYEHDCLQEPSLYDGAESLCEWDAFYNMCKNHTPQTSAFTVVGVVVLAQLLAYPVLTGVEYILKKIGNCTITGEVHTPLSSQKLGMARAVLQGSTRSGFNFGAKKVAPIRHIVRFKSASQELLELEAAVQEHISGMEVHRACVLLRRMHRYLSVPEGYKSVHDLTGNIVRAGEDMDGDAELPPGPLQFRGENLHDLLTRLIRRAQREYQHMEALDEEAKAVRVMQLFALDLLPKFTAKVVAGKIERDRARPWILPGWTIVLIWTAIFSVNALAFGLVLYWSLSAGNEKQTLWLNCLMFWLCFEPFMVNFGTVLTAHLFLPSLVAKGLQVAKQEINAVVDRYVVEARRKESRLNTRASAAARFVCGGQTGFNFAPYFMLSQRLARVYPQLRESRVVQAFRTDLSIYAAVLDPQPTTEEGLVVESRWKRRVKQALHDVTDAFLSTPIYIQDTFICGAVTIIAGLICLLHIVLYKTSPGLIVIPPVLTLAFMAVVLVRNYREKLTAEGMKADLVLTVHDHHLPVIDLVDTARDDIMQSKFLRQDGVHAMLAPAAGTAEAEAAEHKVSDMAEDHPLHVIVDESDLEYDPNRRHENILEFRRQQKEREAEELLAKAQANGPESAEGMQLMLRSSMAALDAGDEQTALDRLQAKINPVRSVLPALIERPNLAKIEEQAQFSNVVRHKIHAISERIKSRKFTSQPIEDEEDSDEEETPKPEERSWLPSKLIMSELGGESSEGSDNEKAEGSPRRPESPRRTILAARMQNLKISPTSRSRGAMVVGSPKATAITEEKEGDKSEPSPTDTSTDGPDPIPQSIKLPAVTPPPLRKLASRVINVTSSVKEPAPSPTAKDMTPALAATPPKQAFLSSPALSPVNAGAPPVRPNLAGPSGAYNGGGPPGALVRPLMQASPIGAVPPGVRPTVNRFQQGPPPHMAPGRPYPSPSAAPSRAGSVSQGSPQRIQRPGGQRPTVGKNGGRRQTTRKAAANSSSSSSGSSSSTSASSSSSSSSDGPAGLKRGGSSSSSSSSDSDSGSSSSSSSGSSDSD